MSLVVVLRDDSRFSRLIICLIRANADRMKKRSTKCGQESLFTCVFVAPGACRQVFDISRLKRLKQRFLAPTRSR